MACFVESIAEYPREVREGIYDQFAALDTAADALIEKTRSEAS